MKAYYVVLVVPFALSMVTGQINFPGSKPKTPLPSPKPCGDLATFCGEDADSYPVADINSIFKETEALQSSAEAFDRFFRAGTPLNKDRNKNGAVGRENTACQSRTEHIPRFARAKNIKGKWKYVLQGENGSTQNYQITVCSIPDEVCVNDRDSPEGDGRTICRQIYKTEKLLALDEYGDVVVDTFPLPSACVCHFRESPLSDFSARDGHLSALSGKSASKQASSKVDDRCEETESSLDAVVKAQSRSGLSSFSFPGRTSSGRKRKRKILPSDQPDFSSRSSVGEDDEDDDRIYFGRRTLRQDRFRQGRKRRQTFKKSEPLRDRSNKAVPISTTKREAEEGDGPDLCSDDFCTNDPDYPLLRVMSGLSNHGTLDDKKAFSSLFGATCGNATGLVDVSLRQSFDLKESPLCKAYQKYIFPQKALTVRGEYKYIINTEEYRQGVTVETCSNRAKGRSCKYGGREGNFPSATACKQMYSLQNMLAIDEDSNKVYVETFKIPSACVCELIDRGPFEP